MPGVSTSDNLSRSCVGENQPPLIYRFPLIWTAPSYRGMSLIAIGLLRKIESISKNGLTAPTSFVDIDDKFKKLTINQRSLIKSRVQKIFSDVLSPFSRYSRETKRLGLRVDGNNFELEIGEPEIITTIFITIYGNGQKIRDEILKNKIEKAAMEISADYERSKEDVAKINPEVYKEESYDILSYLKNGRLRYIEVKGHLSLEVYAELTENEYKMAEKLGDDYYLHLVINLRLDEYEEVDKSGALLLEFRDPLKSMKVKKTGGETKYFLFP